MYMYVHILLFILLCYYCYCIASNKFCIYHIPTADVFHKINASYGGPERTGGKIIIDHYIAHTK